MYVAGRPGDCSQRAALALQSVQSPPVYTSTRPPQRVRVRAGDQPGCHCSSSTETSHGGGAGREYERAQVEVEGGGENGRTRTEREKRASNSNRGGRAKRPESRELSSLSSCHATPPCHPGPTARSGDSLARARQRPGRSLLIVQLVLVSYRLCTTTSRAAYRSESSSLSSCRPALDSRSLD